MEQANVVVIGGGATGTGILRDLAMRGIEAILIEQYDLAHGTSSRFHGLLHSGARYAVNDPESARECIKENRILREIGRGSCVEDIEGLFIQLPQDDSSYVENWLKSCREVGIPVQEISIAEALELEPNITKEAVRAFIIPDGAIDGFRLVWANVGSAERYGAKAYTYTRLEKVLVDKKRITGVVATNTKNGERYEIKCNYVINAAGAWAGEVAKKAGLELEVIADKGTLLVFNHRITSRVINRLRKPDDGDIIVPHGTVSIFGTTSVEVESPNCLESDEAEVAKLTKLGKEMFPNIDNFRVLRSFSGIRPLYQEPSKTGGAEGAGRAVTRSFALIDHRQEGVAGMISVVGGKFTTYRLMAEKAVDHICQELGNSSPCRTAEESLQCAASGEQLKILEKLLGKVAAYKLAERLGGEAKEIIKAIKAVPSLKQIVCECEQVTLAEILMRAQEKEQATLNDIRRRTRLGMGTCQGNVCTSRAVGQLYERGDLSFDDVNILLNDFLTERWKGNKLTVWGEQARQLELMRNRYHNLYNIAEKDEEYEV